MSLIPGTALGPYEVTAKIGEGGMGEVYRARDTNRHSNSVTIVGLAALALSFSGPVSAQQVGPGSYTAVQADIGASVYAEQCLVCHLDDLRGSFEAPELAGANFRSTWGARPVTDLVNLVASTMPPQAVGSLTTEEVAGVVAYLLQANGVEPGTRGLTVASGSTVIPGTEPVAATERAGIAPVPGRVGTVPSSDSVQSPPEFRGVVSETTTSLTETYRPAEWLTPVSEAELASPPDGDWLHWRRSPGSNGFSPLSQINSQNVHRLQLAWVWGLPDGSRYRTAPLERDGVLFLTAAGDRVQTLDASEGTLLWEYRRNGASGGERVQSLAIWEDQLLVSTSDAAMVALDARTGRVRWETQIAALKHGHDAVGDLDHSVLVWRPLEPDGPDDRTALPMDDGEAMNPRVCRQRGSSKSLEPSGRDLLRHDERSEAVCGRQAEAFLDTLILRDQPQEILGQTGYEFEMGSLDCHRASAILRDGLTTVEKADPSLAQLRIDFDLWLSRNPEPSSWEERQYGFIPD